MAVLQLAATINLESHSPDLHIRRIKTAYPNLEKSLKRTNSCICEEMRKGRSLSDEHLSTIRNHLPLHQWNLERDRVSPNGRNVQLLQMGFNHTLV